MQQTPSNNFKINSQYFIQQLDNLIVQLVKTLSIEHGIKPDPDAKEMVRQLLLNRTHALLSDESIKNTKEFISNIESCLKLHLDHKIPIEQVYEFIKLMRLDNV